MLDEKKLEGMDAEQLLGVVHILGAQVDGLTKLIQDKAGLGDTEIRDMDRLISEKVSGLVGDVFGEGISLALGNEKLANDVADVVTSVGDTIGRLFSRYSPVTIGSLIGGNGDGQNGWYYFGLDDSYYDDNLTEIEMPAGVYGGGIPGAPTGNDGAFGRRENGTVVATSYDVFWKPHALNEWSKEIPQEAQVSDPKDPSLLPGAYVFSFGSPNTPSREDFNGIGKHSRRTHGILHIKPSGERVIYHAYFGQRAWVLK